MSTKVITFMISIIVLMLLALGGFNFFNVYFTEGNDRFENMNISFSIEGNDEEGDISLSFWGIFLIVIVIIMLLVVVLIIFSAIREMKWG